MAPSHHLAAYLTTNKTCALYLYPMAYYVSNATCQLHTEAPSKVGLYKEACSRTADDKYYSLIHYKKIK
jgi:hypothetical protein